MKYLSNIWFSLPVQLFILHLKKNQVLLFAWGFLIAIIAGKFGSAMGIHYLFLDPEYLNKVGFSSFFIMGLVVGAFSVSFHITCYILYGFRLNFIGVMPRPFSRFSLNNSIIPLGFLLFYVLAVVRFQLENQFTTDFEIVVMVAGLLSGYLLMIMILYVYFRFTNKDIFRYMVVRVDANIKSKVKVSRKNVMSKLKAARDPRRQVNARNYLDLDFKVKKVTDDKEFYDKSTILQVFDQNHLNLVILQLVIIGLLLLLGVFRELPVFQLPAAASVVLFMTIFVMFTGAFSYWFRGWATSIVIVIFLVLNFVVKQGYFQRSYYAFGLDYSREAADYNLQNLQGMNSYENYLEDKSATRKVLDNWRSKFPRHQKPKIVFMSVSGGGLRSALWTMNVLQATDSLTRGKLMDHTFLITGASGGIIGASYFRELLLQKAQGQPVDLSDPEYIESISNDNLNPVIFSLLVNDLFISNQKFNYGDFDYPKDRGYAFEEQLNKNTGGFLDKPLKAYEQAERDALIPMLIMAPTIINDGRKLYISTQSVSYMNSGDPEVNGEEEIRVKGVDFLRLFAEHGADSIRYLSALRMSATFPYITPNITLPSEPPIQIMDAGITDNFGVSDAVRFAFVFRDWILDNTSGVVFLSIRDSEKQGPVSSNTNLSLLEKLGSPISAIYNNFENIQDINNDIRIEYATTWFRENVEMVTFEYVPRYNNQDEWDFEENPENERASLNWRLTSKEKQNIIGNLESYENQQALERLLNILNISE